jgi:phosphoglycerol transferase MdoB-like AlkP superfamily enzyme
MIRYERLRLLAPLGATICNLLMLYPVYVLSRVAYLVVNYSFFGQDLTWSHLLEMMGGGLLFDTAAILVTNIPYIVLMLFPLHLKETKVWQQVCRWVYLVINGVALAMNLADAVYFKYTMRRTTSTVFSEFSNDNNLGRIILTEAMNHVILILLFGLVLWVLWKCYVQPRLLTNVRRWWHYDLAMLLSLAAVAPFVVAGIRGGFATAVRPIAISNANQFANRPIEAALVLNTPFAIYRTIDTNVFTLPDYFDNPEELATIYSPVHAAPGDSLIRKNVVVLIVESFGREYIGALNANLEGGLYKGYTPFVDSLVAQSITFSRSFCNGRKSIDGMPSILSSIPMFVEPFFLTPSSMNQVSGIASLLAAEGYSTAFFHGAQRGSMGFQAFARATGFQEYYGREDFEADDRFEGADAFDGTWAIWDEPFLQYFATKMSEMREPFMTSVFTASSHHPYIVPEKYRDRFPEEGIEIHKCIRYTDMALSRFFKKARRQDWFKNTIFVLTSDHTNLSDHPYYQTDLGGFCSPIIIYEPGNPERQPEMIDKIAQQIDILPTVLGMLHYPKPYFAFGIDLLNTPAEDTWAVNYLNGVYQYVKHNYLLQFDGQNTIGFYSLNDSVMNRNLVGKISEQPQMERELKAIIQQYMERMINDRLTVDETE